MTTSDRQGFGQRDRDRLDVDVRFLLANERTMLAWLRTGLTLQAGGVALAQLSRGNTWAGILGVALLALGGIGTIVGYLRFRATDRALRAGQMPSPGRGVSLVVASVVVLGVGLVGVYTAALF